MPSGVTPRLRSRLATGWILSAIMLVGTWQPPQPLVVIRTDGGLCPDARPCSATVTIYRDGMIRVGGAMRRLDRAVFEELKRQIAAADFTAIRSRRFTGTCPTAYDGQEIRYEFHVRGTVQTLRSCATAIDPSQPPFKLLNQILEAVRAAVQR